MDIAQHPNIDAGILGLAFVPAIPFTGVVGRVEKQFAPAVIHFKIKVVCLECIEGKKVIIEEISIRTKGIGHCDKTTFEHMYFLSYGRNTSKVI